MTVKELEDSAFAEIQSEIDADIDEFFRSVDDPQYMREFNIKLLAGKLKEWEKWFQRGLDLEEFNDFNDDWKKFLNDYHLESGKTYEGFKVGQCYCRRISAYES